MEQLCLRWRSRLLPRWSGFKVPLLLECDHEEVLQEVLTSCQWKMMSVAKLKQWPILTHQNFNINATPPSYILHSHFHSGK